MVAVIQRVSEASVKIENEIAGSIDQGYVILLGICNEDTSEDIEWLTKKICSLRIFSDAEDKMNLTISQIKGDILLVSQFTLLASTKKGNRPSFVKAARPEVAIPLYEQTVLAFSKLMGNEIQTGQFGADMKVSLCNDGPVTIVIDTKDKK